MNGDNEFETLPHADLPAERAALGAAMQSADAMATVAEQLRSEHFVRAAHQLVFEALTELYGRGAPTDIVGVRGYLEDRKQILAVGGPLGLHALIEAAPVRTNTDYYVSRILDKAAQRGIESVRETLRGIAADPNLDRADRTDAAWQAMERLTAIVPVNALTSVADLLTPTLDNLEKPADASGVPTGWRELNDLIPKLKPGQLITIGARPGIGKTVIMVNIAYHVGVTLGLPVFLGTLEMSSEEIMLRLIAHAGKVNLKRLMNPEELTNHDWERIQAAQQLLYDAQHLVIDDEPGMNVAYIRSRLRAMRRTGHPAALVVVDYLQLMQASGKVESRQVEVSEFSRSFKRLAKEFTTPIIVGSQLNRGVELRSSKRPMLADLRESGSVEQDSDVVIMLYREDAYEPDSPRAGEIDLIVEKNRSGPRGTATLSWQGHYARAADMQEKLWSPSGAVA